MKPVVRVTAEVPCGVCRGRARRPWDSGVGYVCGHCHGTGTVARDVTCGECYSYQPHETYGDMCLRYGIHVPADHGCKLWKSRE